MRGWRMGVWGLVVGAVLAAGPAVACKTCTTENTCAFGMRGALICLEGPESCLQGGRCWLGSGIMDDPGTLGVTLLEDGSAAVPGGARLARAGEPATVGRAAARFAARELGGSAPEARVLYAGSGYFDSGTAVFRTREGDGFALTRETAGRGARLTVRAVSGRQPGRVLASEIVGESDALAVRVPFGGRTRMLVLTAATLPRPEAGERHAADVRALRAEGTGRPVPAELPFDLSVSDR